MDPTTFVSGTERAEPSGNWDTDHHCKKSKGRVWRRGVSLKAERKELESRSALRALAAIPKDPSSVPSTQVMAHNHM